MEPILCFIRESFFLNHKEFIKMLDSGNPAKQSGRTHLFVMIEMNKNHFLIPLRNHLGDEIRKFGRIGHAVPSETRENAGLDFRYAIIVNDEKYLEIKKERRIPKSQYRKIKKDYDEIVKEFTDYVNGYKKAAKKNRHQKEPLYRESSLINFLSEL